MPSAKYSWFGSLDRLVSGRTASEWITGGFVFSRRRWRRPPRFKTNAVAARIKVPTAPMTGLRRRVANDERAELTPSACLAAEALATPLIEPTKRYPRL